MEIGIDFRPALTSRAGIGRYARGLVAGFTELLDAEPALRVRLYAFHAKRVPHAAPSIADQRIRVRRGPVPARIIDWLGRAGYGCETHFGRVDLFHFTDFASLPFRRTPHVFTLHDVGFLVNPRWHETRAVAALERVIERLVETASLVLVHSAHTAGEATRWLGLPADRIRVVAPGVDARFNAGIGAPEIVRVRRGYRVPARYVLAVGTLEPRKNLIRLIAAFGRVAAHDAAVSLVLAGGRGWLDGEILRAIDDSPFSDRILRLGAVADDDLPALYAGATAASYVSLYEGFGLPALEALAAGVPTVVSATSSLPEVVGDAALTVDPEDTAAIADGLRTLLDDASLRARLRAAGPERAARFTWRRTAAGTLAAYRDALGCGVPHDGVLEDSAHEHSAGEDGALDRDAKVGA